MTRIHYNDAYRLVYAKGWDVRGIRRANGNMTLLCNRGDRSYALIANAMGTIAASAVDTLMTEAVTASSALLH